MKSLPASSTDTDLLEAYASDPATLRGARADVAAAAARALVTRGSSLGAARSALVALAGDPPCDQPSALEPLVDLAATAGASVDDAVAFTSAAAAWKVLTYAIVTGPAPAPCDVLLRKRVLLTAGMSASAVLNEMTQALSSSTADPTDVCSPAIVARYVKVVRFHVSNLARCAKRFMEQGTTLTYSDACTSVTLRLLGLVLHLAVLDVEFVPTSCATDLEHQVLALAAAASRAVLIMCRDSAQVAGALDAAFSVSIPGLSQAQLSGRLAAVAYVVRLAETGPTPHFRSDSMPSGAESPSNLSRGGSNGDHVNGNPFEALTNLLRCAYVPVLLPLVFQLTSQLHATAFKLRTRGGGHALAAISVSSVVSCALRTDDEQRLIGSLLEYSSSQNALVAYVAGESLVSVASRIPGVFEAVMSVARVSLAADIGCASSRWVSLAARIGVVQYYSEGCVARSKLPEVLSMYGRWVACGYEKSFPCDAAGVRVLGEMCRIAYESTSSEASIDAILKHIGWSKEEICSFCKRTLLGSSHTGRLSEACMLLLGFVGDTRALTGAAVASLKRGTASLRLSIVALRCLPAKSIPDSSLRTVAVELPRLIARHGALIQISGLALAGRLPQSAGNVLRQVIEGADVRAHGKNIVLEAAAMFYGRSQETALKDVSGSIEMSAGEDIICAEEQCEMNDGRLETMQLNEKEAMGAVSSIAAGLTALSQIVTTTRLRDRKLKGTNCSTPESRLPPVVGGELAALSALVPALATVADASDDHIV